MQQHISKIADELQIKASQVSATIKLLDEGSTVPFISRYRKEMTGSLDEVAVTNIRDRVTQLRELDKRRDSILKSIEEQGKLSDELAEKINAAENMARLEDLYLPYKPKRRTKATIAKEKGLEPLATLIFEQGKTDLSTEANKYIDAEKEVNNEEEALQGARDIIAEWVNEDQEARAAMRDLFMNKASFQCKVISGKEEEGQKYKDYFDWEEPVKTAPSHRVLAMRRGEKEMILMLNIAPPEEEALQLLKKTFVTGNSALSEQVEMATKDSYKRLLKPSIETDIRLSTKKKADEEAIHVFADNLRELLMSSPLGEKNTLAIDPGFRTGCKLVCLNKQGRLLENTAIFPNEPQRKTAEAEAIILAYCQKYDIEAIAIGNGTASRETEAFVRSIKHLPKNIQVVMVNESGASVYSASDVAREEFPDYDLTVRGAVSIGRRLMDPLAELVKLDPKSIGVGQYQHDVDQTALRQSLDDTVVSCVNNVGVEVNTASKQLLTYVSGLGPSLAQSIVNYRDEKGPFKTREELLSIPRLGNKAFEQAAGFLRIRDAANPLDRSAVHPERYETVNQMAADLGCTIEDLIKDENLRKRINLKQYVSEEVGLPTLEDIMAELSKPGRDPREQFEAFQFMEGVHELEDLKVGMKLPGIITNVTNFGAFVDLGVHQDGLVHISHLADKFVDNPAEIVKVHQQVQVTVMEVDVARKRIGLSMKSDPFAPPKKGGNKPTKKGRKQEEESGDLQSKLAMLKNKFR
ncbi:Tex family protein [Catalinimonas sp. 4WD22]|uniref:Tex family protein n=1 Tax=Catalinimonas locisalis TaxID=3133978 RepID=UPI003101A966